MASTSKVQGGRMTVLAPTASTTVKSRTRATPLNYKSAFLLWVCLIQYINLFTIGWAVAVPESSRGIIGLIGRDFRATPLIVAVFYLFAIGVTWRGSKPRYGLLLILTGQLITASAALWYMLHDQITITQGAGHIGLFVLQALGIAAMTQYRKRDEYEVAVKKALTDNTTPPPIKRFFAPVTLIPAIGIILLTYAVGLAARPDSGIAIYITSQYMPIVVDVLIAWMGIGGGFVVLNHLAPKYLYVAVFPVLIYAVMAGGFLRSDNNVSFTGIMVHGELWVTMMFVVMIQIKEYARTVKKEARGA